MLALFMLASLALAVVPGTVFVGLGLSTARTA